MPGGRPALIAAACILVLPALVGAQDAPMDSAKHAFEKGDYPRAIEILTAAAGQEPGNGDIYLWLTKSHLEMKQYDAAVGSGEKAVAANPKSSVYHQWLGQAYGEKADHASMLSAYSLARKTRSEFQTAVDLDERNFDVAQNLIEFDCTAPGMVGGGEDKARPLIQKLMGMDPAEGHFGEAVCRARKKDAAAADAEYLKSLQSKPKSADRIYDIGDYFVQRGQADKLLAVADAGESLAPGDLRGKFYRAAGWILGNQKLPEAEKLLRDYLQSAPVRSTYPKPWEAHYWLGRLHESENNSGAAREEYKAALELDPKYKAAQEALKKLGSH
jgi:tetratricopeptide (TPR) repeat protein